MAESPVMRYTAGYVMVHAKKAQKGQWTWSNVEPLLQSTGNQNRGSGAPILVGNKPMI